MRFLAGFFVDMLLGGLICLGGFVLFFYGGGFGLSIIIIIKSLYKYWFPIKETPGDIIANEEKNINEKGS